VFAAKAAGLRLKRALQDIANGPPRLRRGEADGFTAPAGAATSALWSDESLAERRFQIGKVENLRIACRALDGLVIPAGQTFSVWRQLGPPIRARGYVEGRMLREGCVIPAVGGGLCQLSNALYQAALAAGCRILERHPHSRLVPGSAAAFGRDATVAWNYVDLRFAPDRDLRLTARLSRSELRIELTARDALAPTPAAPVEPPPLERGSAESCGACGESGCFRHQAERRARPHPGAGRVFLVDEAWPELQDHVRAELRSGDRLGRPRGGGSARYGWSLDGVQASDAAIQALRRSLAVRLAGADGPRRRHADLIGAEAVAAGLARRLRPQTTAVTVAQSYLPFLWRAGHLGGREVTVLMTRLPLGVLHARLDAAAAAHPDRASLADFRAPAWLVQAEAAALAEAARIVTPHAEIAALFGERALRLPWRAPPAAQAPRRPIRVLAFPGPTAARKGAFELREAALALDLEVIALGSALEGEGFWRGVRLRPGADWRAADAVVHPALVEDQPRFLLAALAAGFPVIATPACGLDPQPGLTMIPAGDAGALIEVLRGLTQATV
jgi:hypothetical protein